MVRTRFSLEEGEEGSTRPVDVHPAQNHEELTQTSIGRRSMACTKIHRLYIVVRHYGPVAREFHHNATAAARESIQEFKMSGPLLSVCQVRSILACAIVSFGRCFHSLWYSLAMLPQGDRFATEPRILFRDLNGASSGCW